MLYTELTIGSDTTYNLTTPDPTALAVALTADAVLTLGSAVNGQVVYLIHRHNGEGDDFLIQVPVIGGFASPAPGGVNILVFSPDGWYRA